MKRNVIIVLISVLLLTCLFAFARTTTTNLGLVKPTWEEDLDILTDVNANSDILDAIFDDVSLIEFDYLDGVTSAIQTQFGLRYLKTEVNTIGKVETIWAKDIIDSTELAAFTGQENIVTVGTIATGTWEGTAITDGYIPNTITIDLATLATTLTVSNNESTSETNAILFTSGGVESGNLNIETDGGDFHYNPNTGTLTTTVLTVSGAIATATNVSMTGELDMTGVNAVIDLNPAQRGTVQVINITPSATLNTNEAVWRGILINGNALDPSGTDISVYGICLDFSTFSPSATGVHVDGYKAEMPDLTEHALHIIDGKVIIEGDVPPTAIAQFTGIDFRYGVHNMVSTSMLHAIDVAVTEGTPAGDIVAVGTHTHVDVIHQHIGTFESPDQEGIDSFAGIDDGGDYIDGIDDIAMFNTNGDGFWIGDGDMFDELEVDMSTDATKDVEPTFWYWKTDDWEPFEPADDTDGFQHSGLIRWVSGDLTGWSSGDPADTEGATGYWIRVLRTATANPGTPTAETIKTGAITLYSWDKTGDLSIKDIDAASLILDTALAIAEGGTNSGTGLGGSKVMVSSATAIVESADITVTELGYLNGATGTTGSAALVFGTEPTFTTRITTPEVKAASSAGLKLYEDGGAGIFVEDGGNVGILKADPATALHVQGNLLIGNLDDFTEIYSGFDASTIRVLEVGEKTATNQSLPYAMIILSKNMTDSTDGIVGNISFVNIGSGVTEKRLAGITVRTAGELNSGDLRFFTTNTSTFEERLRITKEGYINIGSSGNPSGNLDINVATGEDAHFLLSENDVTKWDIYNDHNDDALQIKAGATLVMEIAAGGEVFLPIGQLNFPDSQNASGDANTLDDYEEGEWTPALKFGGNSNNMTYSYQAGLYTKIGRQVTLTGFILLSDKGDSTGNATITALPFSSANVDGARSPISITMTTITFAARPQGYIDKNSGVIILTEVDEAGASSNLTDADFENTSNMIFSVTYFID